MQLNKVTRMGYVLCHRIQRQRNVSFIRYFAVTLESFALLCAYDLW